MRVVIPSEVTLVDEPRDRIVKPATWFCYMLRCKDGSLYVGVAMDPMHRVKQHNWAVGAKFTAQRRPVELIWWEKLPDHRPPGSVKFCLKGGDGKKLSLLSNFGDRVYPSAAEDATSG